MSYRFKLDEDAEAGFQRIARQQIAKAETELASTTDAARAVHDARKSIKRVRALLRLVRSGLGDTTFRRANTRFRDIAQTLSAARDGHVIAETLTMLEESNPRVSRAAFREARRVALAGKRGNGQHDLEDRRPQAIADLEREREALPDMAFDSGAGNVLMSGFHRTYKAGRDAFRLAYESWADEDFHDWRKTVQHHWRHLALMNRAWPEYFEARANEARELAHILGDDHDLAVLAATLEDTSGPVVSLCRKRQSQLRAAARLRGERLYADGPRQLRRRIDDYWRIAGRMAAADGLDCGERSSDKVAERERQVA